MWSAQTSDRKGVLEEMGVGRLIKRIGYVYMMLPYMPKGFFFLFLLILTIVSPSAFIDNLVESIQSIIIIL